MERRPSQIAKQQRTSITKIRKEVTKVNRVRGAIKLTEREANKTSNITNYIPHHCVSHPEKPNKVRVVFDAFAKYKNDSLNNHLLNRPDLINNLVSILIQFRLGKYAVTADIKQMFHQVKVKKSDQDALRFL